MAVPLHGAILFLVLFFLLCITVIALSSVTRRRRRLSYGNFSFYAESKTSVRRGACKNANATLIRIACMGDSLSMDFLGDGASYPVAMEAYLREAGIANIEVRAFGHAGVTLLPISGLPYIVTKAWADALIYNPHIVVLILGTHDANLGDWPGEQGAGGVEMVRQELMRMVRTLRTLPAHPDIILGEPPPVLWGALRSLLANENLHVHIIPAQHAVQAQLNLPSMFSLQEPAIEHSDSAGGIHLNRQGRLKVGRIAGQAVLDCLGWANVSGASG